MKCKKQTAKRKRQTTTGNICDFITLNQAEFGLTGQFFSRVGDTIQLCHAHSETDRSVST
jgi:hypothetical protein